MRIGMILSTPLPPQEGIGFYAWNLARFLAAQGHTVHLATRGRASKVRSRTSEGITIWWLPFIPIYPFHVHLHGLFVNRWLQQMQDELDLLHLHSPLVATPATQVPWLVTVHSVVKLDTATVRTDHLLGWLIRLQVPFSASLERNLVKTAGRIVTVSSTIAEELGVYGIQASQVGVLGNAVDTNFFSPARENPSPHPIHNQRGDGRKADRENPYVFTAGRLAPPKGIEDLVPCAARVAQVFPGIQFIIAGSGPLENELRRAIAAHGLGQNITLLGAISERRAMIDLYRGAAVYALPSHHEGLPTVLLEAMACGCPVVSTAVSGALDVVEDGVNGLLVPPSQPQALAEAILKVLKDPPLGCRLGLAARRTVEERYAWEAVGRHYLEEYARLLEAKGGYAA